MSAHGSARPRPGSWLHPMIRRVFQHQRHHALTHPTRVPPKHRAISAPPFRTNPPPDPGVVRRDAATVHSDPGLAGRPTPRPEVGRLGMGHAHRLRAGGSPPRRYCRAAVRPGAPPAPHPHRPMPSLPLHMAPPVAPPALAVRDLEANPPRAARPIRQRCPPPAMPVDHRQSLCNPQRDTSDDARVTRPLVTNSNQVPHNTEACPRSVEHRWRPGDHQAASTVSS